MSGDNITVCLDTSSGLDVIITFVNAYVQRCKRFKRSMRKYVVLLVVDRTHAANAQKWFPDATPLMPSNNYGASLPAGSLVLCDKLQRSMVSKKLLPFKIIMLGADAGLLDVELPFFLRRLRAGRYTSLEVQSFTLPWDRSKDAPACRSSSPGHTVPGSSRVL